MRKRLLAATTIAMTFFFVSTFVHADVNRPVTKPTRENILEDALIDLMDTQMTQAAEKYYGVKQSKGVRFQCRRVVSIKKIDGPGSMMFEAKIEGMTFFGAHNPPNDIFTVTIRDDYHTNGWEMKSFKVRKLKSHEVYECRDPA